jgi:4-hydroxybenzoate polyprenyltransferase
MMERNSKKKIFHTKTIKKLKNKKIKKLNKKIVSVKNKINEKQIKKKLQVNQESKKEFTIFDKLIGLFELGRPIEWSKSLLNMLLAVMMAHYIFRFEINYSIFALGFIAVASLWASLYALNDYTDRELDAQHKVKKNRPIPCGKVSPQLALGFVVVMLGVSFGIAYALGNFLLGLCLLVMVANQLLYTMKPYRLKSRKYFDFISGSMINPIFRYFSGMVLFVPSELLFNNITPLLPLIFVVCMQFGGYSLYRLFSKKDDQKFKMNSSVAKLSEEKVKMISYLAIAIAIIAYISMIANGYFYKSLFWGYLPIQFAWALVLPLIFVPLLKDAILNPSKASMKVSYRAIYVMNIAFILANLLIFILLP